MNFFNKRLTLPVSLVFLLLFNLLARALVVFFTDLGIDEAYYFSYASVRDWSYYDHPPLIGQLIYITTLGLKFCSVFFVRFGPLLLGTINLVLIYLIGKEIGGHQTGFRAALMASASFYVSVVSGAFIMPDTPLAFFWLLSLWFSVKLFLTRRNIWLLLFGLSVGLAMLSKYQAVFLWLGLGLYILFQDRKWFKSKYLYFSILITAILFLPVVWWNLNHNLASLAFHGNRVGFGQIKIHWFAQEMAGQIFYNNPVVVFIIVFTVVAFFRKNGWAKDRMMLLLAGFSFPLALIALLISMFNRTLPHWSGPAYYALFLFSSELLGRMAEEKRICFQKSLYWANAFLLSVLIIGALHINIGILPVRNEPDRTRQGRNDFSLDLYGWKQMGDKLEEWVKNQEPWEDEPVFFTRNWFPGGHLSYYFARPYQHSFWVYGSGKEQHHFIEVNRLNEPVKEGNDLVYIALSTNFRPLPEEVISWFASVDEPDVIPILRNKHTVYNIFVYRLRCAQKNLDFSDFLLDKD